MSYNHEFRLIVNRWPESQEWDELADTCHDAGWGRRDGHPQIEYSRYGNDLSEAVISAIHELQTRHNIETVAIEPIDQLWWPDVADRVGMTAAALDVKIAASPVAHPKPMLHPGAGGGPVSFYHWPEVVEWLAAHGVTQGYDETLQAVAAMLASVEPQARTPDRMRRRVIHEIKRIGMWRMPEWMEPYRSFIAETGGNEIEELIFSFDHDKNLARTNFPRFAIACMARAQVGLLQRLHKDGSLPPAPNGDGGWGR